MNGCSDPTSTPILEVDTEEVKSVSGSSTGTGPPHSSYELNSDNEQLGRKTSLCGSFIEEQQHTDNERRSSSVASSSDPCDQETLSPIPLYNGKKQHRRNLSNLTTGSGKSGSMDSVSLV